MMELWSVTCESVKVRKQSNAKSSWLNNGFTLLPCFISPSFSHPQRVVRVDPVFPLFTTWLPGRSYQWQYIGLNPTAFQSLFGPGVWSAGV